MIIWHVFGIYNLKSMYILKVMSERDNFYNSLPYSKRLHVWKDLIDKGNIKEAITYWTKYQAELNVNAYVKKGKQWLPVIYYCCLEYERSAMVRYLLMSGADVDCLPDADKYEYLPFICNSLYLIEIAKKTKHHPYKLTPVLSRSINNRLNGGDSRRLDHLMRLGLLSEDSVQHVIRNSTDIILDKLQSMVTYLTYVYNVRATADSDLDIKDITYKTILKFVSTAEFLVAHNAPCTLAAANYCIDHYLYEFLPMFHASKVEWCDPVYHTQKNSTLTAILRPLLNDRRYVHTCSACDIEPDEDVYQYNITT